MRLVRAKFRQAISSKPPINNVPNCKCIIDIDSNYKYTDNMPSKRANTQHYTVHSIQHRKQQQQ